jgi:hypothetical protein
MRPPTPATVPATAWGAPAPPGREPRGLFPVVYRVSNVLLFAALPVVLTLVILSAGYVRGPFLYDFKGGLYGAGHDIAHGQNPYRAAYLERQAALKRAGHAPQTVISVPVYPAPALVAAVPFGLLPYAVAAVLFSLLSVGALLGGLRLAGVRDWRCYGLAFISWPVVHGLMLGAMTPLLVLGTAAAWRYRDRLWPPAIAIAALIAAKLFPWPLAIWLLVTRRARAFALMVVLALTVTFGAWAAIGFAGLADYPRMLDNLSYVSEGVGVSTVAGLVALGLPAGAAKAVALALAALVVGAAWRLSRRPDGGRRAFGLIVVSALVASPMVWPHYFALLFVPIALASPGLSPLWFVPLLAYLAPDAQTTGRPWAIALYLAIAAVPLFRLCARRPLPSERVVTSPAT